MKTISQGHLRAEFARQLSEMYGREVPAYTSLVEVSREVNAEVMLRTGADRERLGSIGRVSGERHGAIRVGTPKELRQVARIFGGLGMHPVGYYDLREAASSAIPVVSTAFRPIDAEELEHSPFRVFTSMLTPADPRFFDADLCRRLDAFFAARRLFPPELIELAERAERERELPNDLADRFLRLAVGSFELSTEPIDRTWYQTLEAISSVAADIGGLRRTHINHLTPRVLDIDELYQRMNERGITMIDAIQGPPRWHGPDVLLRQTSFRALAEPRLLREPNGTVTTGALRVRFGEVEARGIALTPAGRARYDLLLAAVDRTLQENPDTSRREVARQVWERGMPDTERELIRQDLAFFTYRLRDDHPTSALPPTSIHELLEDGWIEAEPIVYEDFLPRSAAGIFQSNLDGEGAKDNSRRATHYDADWLAGAIDRHVHDPFTLYERQRQASVTEIAHTLEINARPSTREPAEPGSPSLPASVGSSCWGWDQ